MLLLSKPGSPTRHAGGYGTTDMSVAPPAPPLPTHRLVLLTCAMAGVQVSYAAQVNLGTPQLLLLGLPQRLVSYAWVAGPLSGLIVQPIVGRLSDRSTSRFGRRRPFLAVGAVITAAAMLMFSSSREIAAWLSAPLLSLPLAIIAFFLLDFAVQAVQAPLRMLVTDVVPQPQRARANAYLGLFTGAGLLSGGALTALDPATVHRYLPSSFHASHAQTLFSAAAAILLVTTALCIFATSEPPATRTDDPATRSLLSVAPEHSIDESAASIGQWQALRNAPRPYWQLFSVQFCSWVGFFSLFVYVTTWVGHNVFLGDGSAPEHSVARNTFERGVRLGGHANALQAIVTMLYSLALPTLWKRLGVRPVYVFSQLVEATSLMCAPFLRGVPGQSEPSPWLRTAVMLDVASFGVVWATTMSVPWSLVGDALHGDMWYSQHVGLFQTIFNASQSGPQLVVALILAPIIMALSGNNVAWVMFAGGVFGLVGAILVIVLGVDEVATSKHPHPEERVVLTVEANERQDTMLHASEQDNSVA